MNEYFLRDEKTWKSFVQVFQDKEDVKDNGWRGEYWGKMMRGAALCYYYLKDEKLYEVLERTVKDLLAVQDDRGVFSTYDEEHEFNGWDIWGRKYVATGLFHFSDICKDEGLKKQILQAIELHIDYLVVKLGNKRGQKEITKTSDIWGGLNSCTILEPTMELYKRTGKGKYLDFAKYILSTGGSSSGDMIKAALENKLPFEYPVVKAYESMSFFEGVLAYYEETGEEKYFNSVLSFVDSVQKSEITLIGCAGMNEECFNNAVDKQTEKAEKATQETCVTVTWMRLLTRLYQRTGNPKYMESIEKSALNALYGSINVYRLENHKKSGDVTGRFAFDSYSPLYNERRDRETGGLRSLQDNGYYGCCACIGAVAVAVFPLLCAVKGEKGYYFNEYFDGKIQFEDNFSVCLSGDYLKNGKVLLTVEKTDEREREIFFRVPKWCKNFVLKGEGVEQSNQAEYIAVKKIWKTGEKMEIRIDIPFIAIEKNGYKAFQYGPLVLARDNYKEDALKNKDVALSDVGFNLDVSELQIEEKPCQEYETVRFALGQGQEKIILTDYASCGKKWENKDNILSVWFRTVKKA